MRLPENEEEKYKEGNTFSDILFFILSGVIIVALIYCIYSLWKFDITDYDNSPNNTVVVQAEITNIYKYDSAANSKYNGYFIIVSTAKYGKYEIQISKQDFIVYKVGDNIPIKIANCKATIVDKIDQ